MEKLLQLLSKYTLEDIIQIEKSDRQFKALKRLYFELNNKDTFIPLIILNSTVWYLLSSSGEDYWEEFSEYFWNKNFTQKQLPDEIKIFLPISKGNKRLNTHKNARITKITPFITLYEKKKQRYQKNWILFLDDLSKHMNQKKQAKTITFTLKMFAYGVRIQENKDILSPFEIEIPIDSRLTKLYQLYNTDAKISISDFYKKLSIALQIAPLHLDGLIWTKYKELVK